MTPPEQVQSVEQQARDIEPMLKQAGWALSLGAIAAVIEALDTMYGPPPAHETSERRPAVALLREVLENISTVRPLEHFPAVTALAYCREKAIEALNATSASQEVIVGEYEADGKVNMASSPLPEGTKLYARLPLRHSEKAGEPQCSGLCSGLPDANCPVHGLKATLSEPE